MNIERAVIDRFENGQAVLLVGDQERRMVVPRHSLPRGAVEGHWLRLELEGDRLVSSAIDEEETERARRRIGEKLNKLRRGDHLR